MNKNDSNLPILIRWPVGTKSGPEKLHAAVLAGKCGRIRNLVWSGIPVDIRNRDGQSGLFVAATVGNKNVVATLLALGANPNARCYPEGCTPLHGACYVGSLNILRKLLLSGGDLRLSDTKRRTPEEWIDLQGCPDKRRAMRDFIERLRFCVMKSSLEDMKTELKDKMGKLGRFSSFGRRVWDMLTKCCGTSRSDHILAKGLNMPENINSTGFGKLYFGCGTKCVEAIGLPCVSETLHLKYDSNPKAPSWICGKFSTFIPMFWDGRNTAVTSKTLRRKSVEESVPDMLISELSMLVRLQHPQILMILAVCQEENFDSLSLVFEKVELGSLYYFLHQQNFRMKSTFATDIVSLRALSLSVTRHVIQISEALDYIHGSGIIHCGISSHSVMLVGEQQAKLACFEYAIPEDVLEAESYLSTRHPWLSSDSHLSVIRHWVAPEVLIGTHSYSQASDVYSLCSVMWELVVGDLPWKDYDLPSLRLLLKESPGLQLLLRKDVIPPLWLSVLQVGLKRKREDRDLDFKEMRYMMNLAKERASAGSSSGTGGRSNKGVSRTSLRSMSAAHLGQGDNSKRSSTAVSEKNNNYDDEGVGIDVVDLKKLDRVDSALSARSHKRDRSSQTSIAQSFKSEAFLQV